MTDFQKNLLTGVLLATGTYWYLKKKVMDTLDLQWPDKNQNWNDIVNGRETPSPVVPEGAVIDQIHGSR